MSEHLNKAEDWQWKVGFKAFAFVGATGRPNAQGLPGDIWRWVLNDQSSHPVPPYPSLCPSVRLSVDLFVFLFACLFAASPGAAKVSSYSPNFRLHAQRVITVYLSCFYLCLCLCLCLLPVWATLSAKLASSCRHRHIDWLSFLAFIISAKAKSNNKKTRKNEKN